MVQITREESKKLRGMCKYIHIRKTKNKFYLDESKQSLYYLDVIRGNKVIKRKGRIDESRGYRTRAGVYDERA